jgi:hypothetical protein
MRIVACDDDVSELEELKRNRQEVSAAFGYTYIY